MDASALPTAEANLNGVYGFFLQIENSPFATPTRQNNTIIKYTKLPDFDIEPKVSWPEKSYNTQPRQRRLITIDDLPVVTNRSLRSDLIVPLKTMSCSTTKRKIVTIEEDDESDLHPRFSKDVRKSGTVKTVNRAAEAQFKNDKQLSQRTTSRLSNSSAHYSKESKLSVKQTNPIHTTTTNNRKDLSVPKGNRNKYSNVSLPPSPTPNARTTIDKETVKCRSNNRSSKVSLSKNIMTPRESDNEISFIKHKIMENIKPNYSNKKPIERQRVSKAPHPSPKKNAASVKINKNKPINVIHVPLDIKYPTEINDNKEIEKSVIYPCIEKLENISTELERNVYTKDALIGTDFKKSTEDQCVQVENDISCSKCVQSTDVQCELTRSTVFDSLAIPNVTLLKDKNESKEEIVTFHSKSLPNLKVPSNKVTSHKTKEEDSNFVNNTSYIIGHATVTCTTRQKINFHLVGNNNEPVSNQSPSPLAYPINVVSIIQNEIKKKHQNESFEQDDKSNVAYTNCLNELQSLNCSYVLNSSKLVKPSDIISTIRVNNGLLQSDYICEQFQRELNFIDSFFESLQYLESCSLSNKCSDNKVKKFINPKYDFRNSEYNSLLSNLENETNIEVSETMASKSLCLLNLLIRDEQRRAKNLLFVLKMREDALKDFTKSQILWLENKKKQDNTDISTLKKKQRGALLKLQHECGEMQRMRKALLTQSEKRKVALMKTKKNIELKLKNNVDVVVYDQILLSKKKLKRNTSDRNIAPIKCFELSLSSSGCEDSSASKPKSEILLTVAPPSVTSVTCAEKCIQTGDSILGTIHVEQSTDTAAENFVVVDGGYLNILFQNSPFPQIFSSGKQYEVNEEALRNILNSSISQNSFNESDVMAKFIDHVKSPELESSSPSTARSLVEELDQYYKGFVQEEKSPIDSPIQEENTFIYDMANAAVESSQQCESQSVLSASTMASDSTETVLESLEPFVAERSCVCELSEELDLVKNDEHSVPQAGPLPVPVGEPASPEAQPADVTLWGVTNVSSDGSVSSESALSESSLPSLASPSQCSEAEELRRQQLAIEKEIKALEQQQSQLLVLREIPDKPPPPYTPPNEDRSPRPPRMYVADETTEEKIQKYIRDPHTDSCDPTDAFDTFVKDYCIETLESQTQERSDYPWDACNLLPQKPVDDVEKLIKNTSSHLLDLMTCIAPTMVSGVGARRSDHIDDILFTEWRRCEPEWTSLQSDEALVKNQIFESIFQKILTETIDEYKKTVLVDE